MTTRGKTTPASTDGSYAPHTGPRSRVELDAGGEGGGENGPTVVEVQYIGGGSDKFYRVETDGTAVTITYGRNGTAGTSSTTDLGDPDKAAAFAAKKLKEKVTKGYRPVEGSTGTAAAVMDDIAVDASVLPMLAKVVDPERVPALIADDRWVAQLKLDGDRGVLAMRDGKVAMFNRQGQPKKSNVAAAHLAPFAGLEGDWTFDGEIVGRTYHVFDLISAPGMLPNAPFTARQAYLESTLAQLAPNPDDVRLVPTAVGSDAKQALRDNAKANRDEGVIFRRAAAAYDNGRRSDVLLKDKFLKEADCVVTAIHPEKQSVELSVRDWEGRLVPVGQVSTIGKGDVTIGSVVEATFLYVHNVSEPRMVQPRIARLRHDKTPDECSIEQFQHAGTNKGGNSEDAPEPDDGEADYY